MNTTELYRWREIKSEKDLPKKITWMLCKGSEVGDAVYENILFNPEIDNIDRILSRFYNRKVEWLEPIPQKQEGEKYYTRGGDYNDMVEDREKYFEEHQIKQEVSKHSFARMVGEFIGTLKGILNYRSCLSSDVVENINRKITELESISIDDIIKKDYSDDINKIVEENFKGLRDVIEDKDIAEFYIDVIKTMLEYYKNGDGVKSAEAEKILYKHWKNWVNETFEDMEVTWESFQENFQHLFVTKAMEEYAQFKHVEEPPIKKD